MTYYRALVPSTAILALVLSGCAPFCRNKSDKMIQVRGSGYKYISPLLECEAASGFMNGEIHNLDKLLSAYIARRTGRDGVVKIAVYYRDLNNGPAFGVNHNEEFLPASLSSPA